MSGDFRTQTIVPTQDLNDTRWEELLSKFHQFQPAVRREGGGLDDDDVPSQHGGSDFPHCELDGEVPGHDGAYHAEGRVARYDCAFFGVVDDLFWKYEFRGFGEPAGPVVCFAACEDELGGLGISHVHLLFGGI